MHSAIPRILLAGTNSGCGKTTVTCAILQALVNRRLKVGAFKCGPDYIDPMFHSRIIGAKSANLDLFFFDRNTANDLLADRAADRDISIIEGVMGYYDGMGITSSQASSYHLAAATDTPVVLVVNAKGLSYSLLAIIQGFLSMKPDHHICGVILNQCSPMTYPALADMIRSQFAGAVKPLGYLPPMPECTIKSRHLGLVTAGEIQDLREMMQKLALQAERSIDLDGLIGLARCAPPISCQPVCLPRFSTSVRIAVAQDAAFCFYYADSLHALERMGAQLVPFSPISDPGLPPDIHGLYLGGGYPELHAQALSENASMRRCIRQALSDGLPCIAECGGFLYLNSTLGDFPMVGFLDGVCHDTGRLSRFGYVTLTAKQDNLLCRAGEQIRGHEFHHWDCSDNGSGFHAEKASGKGWDCVHATQTLYAGFPHFHFYANPRFGENFYQACIKEKMRHDPTNQTNGDRKTQL